MTEFLLLVSYKGPKPYMTVMSRILMPGFFQQEREVDSDFISVRTRDLNPTDIRLFSIVISKRNSDDKISSNILINNLIDNNSHVVDRILDLDVMEDPMRHTGIYPVWEKMRECSRDSRLLNEFYHEIHLRLALVNIHENPALW